MDLSVELQACLKEFTAEGSIEIRENGGRLAPFSGLSWEVQGAAEKPLLHLWSENHNLTRRVLAITDHSDQRLALAVERFGRAKPDRLEFIRLEFERAQRDLSRDPSVVKDHDYVQNHAELNTYLTAHPEVRDELMANPQNFVKGAQQYSNNGTGTNGAPTTTNPAATHDPKPKQ